jgi:hypothetical protein
MEPISLFYWALRHCSLLRQVKPPMGHKIKMLLNFQSSWTLQEILKSVQCYNVHTWLEAVCAVTTARTFTCNLDAAVHSIVHGSTSTNVQFQAYDMHYLRISHQKCGIRHFREVTASSMGSLFAALECNIMQGIFASFLLLPFNTYELPTNKNQTWRVVDYGFGVYRIQDLHLLLP